VLVGWDEARDRVTVHDGGARPRTWKRADLVRRWRAAGSLALRVEPPRAP
jgi:hypothetical protein